MSWEREVPAGPAGDLSSHTGTLLQGLLVLGSRGMLERLWASWPFGPAQPPLAVCRDGRVPDSPHVLSFLMADRKGLPFPDKRSSS